jgi:hypothetical protein
MQRDCNKKPLVQSATPSTALQRIEGRTKAREALQETRGSPMNRIRSGRRSMMKRLLLVLACWLPVVWIQAQTQYLQTGISQTGTSAEVFCPPRRLPSGRSFSNFGSGGVKCSAARPHLPFYGQVCISCDTRRRFASSLGEIGPLGHPACLSCLLPSSLSVASEQPRQASHRAGPRCPRHVS